MVARSSKMVLLALLLLLPSASRVGATDEPPDRKEILIDDGRIFRFDGDEPLVLRMGRSRHGYIGVRLVEMTPELRAHFGAPRDAGVLVGQVEPDSAAAKAGVAVGDIITAADGDRVEATWDLSRAIRRKKTGETVKLDVSRDHAIRHLTVKVEERKTPEFDLGDLGPRLRGRLRDLEARPFAGRLEDRGRIEERLHELEKRLNELEKKLPAR